MHGLHVPPAHCGTGQCRCCCRWAPSEAHSGADPLPFFVSRACHHQSAGSVPSTGGVEGGAQEPRRRMRRRRAAGRPGAGRMRAAAAAGVAARAAAAACAGRHPTAAGVCACPRMHARLLDKVWHAGTDTRTSSDMHSHRAVFAPRSSCGLMLGAGRHCAGCSHPWAPLTPAPASPETSSPGWGPSARAPPPAAACSCSC
jgi:hypothetical protein